MSASEAYAIYLTSPANGNPTGYVENRVLWDGTTPWSPPAGMASVADPDGKYPIGSTYPAEPA